MKKIITFCIVAIMFLTSCEKDVVAQGLSGFEASSSSEISDDTSNTKDTDLDKDKKEDKERIKSSAIDIIPEFKEIPEDDIMAVNMYFYDIKWMEVNKLPNLERYVPLGEDQYFLIVPKYVGSTIKVKPVVDYKDDLVLADKPTYEKVDTPDGYGLLIKTYLTETTPHLSVSVTYGDKTAYYYFTDDMTGLLTYPISEKNAYICQPKSESKTEKENSKSSLDDDKKSSNTGDIPPFQSGNGKHDNNGVAFLDNYYGEAFENNTLRVDYETKVPESYVKKFKYPDSEWMQNFTDGDYTIRITLLNQYQQKDIDMDKVKQSGQKAECDGYTLYTGFSNGDTLFAYFEIDDLVFEVIGYYSGNNIFDYDKLYSDIIDISMNVKITGKHRVDRSKDGM